MTSQPAPASRRSAPGVTAGVLGLVSAALSGFTAFLVVALGGLAQDDGSGGRWWFLGVLGAAVAQGWGAVRLLRRRGWLLLALGSLPGLLPLLALFGVWLEYRQDPTLLEVVAAFPLLTIVLTLLPSVRRWSNGQVAGSDAGALTTSGA